MMPYKELYKKYHRESNVLKIYIPVEYFYFNWEKIKDIVPELKLTSIINIIFVVETQPVSHNDYHFFNLPGITIENVFTLILSLNYKAIYHMIIGSCFGINMHRYIYMFPRGSTMITFSNYYENTMNYYQLLIGENYFCANDVVLNYISTFKKKLDIPLPIFTFYNKSKYETVNLYNYLKAIYYPNFLYYIEKSKNNVIFYNVFDLQGLTKKQINKQKSVLINYLVIKKRAEECHNPLNGICINKILVEFNNNHSQNNLELILNNLYKKHPIKLLSISYIPQFDLELKINKELIEYLKNTTNIYNIHTTLKKE